MARQSSPSFSVFRMEHQNGVDRAQRYDRLFIISSYIVYFISLIFRVFLYVIYITGVYKDKKEKKYNII